MGPDNINISWNGEVYSKCGVFQIRVVANLCYIKHSLHLHPSMHQSRIVPLWKISNPQQLIGYTLKKFQSRI